MLRSLLVTGGGGFAGRHLLGQLLPEKFAVTAIGRQDSPEWLPDHIAWQRIDLENPDSVSRLEKYWWGVIHLAGQTVPSAFSRPESSLENVRTILPLLDHLESARLLVVSSALVYGRSPDPQSEDFPARPEGRYGLSKHLLEQAALGSANRLDVRIARPFNHVGTGMRENLVIPSILKRISVERGSTAPLPLYGIDSVRDFVDVRDITRAYLEILELPESARNIFNVCSGEGTTISAIATIALGLMNEKRAIQFADQPNSSDDRSTLIGNSERLRNATGWQPKISLEQSLADMVAELK